MPYDSWGATTDSAGGGSGVPDKSDYGGEKATARRRKGYTTEEVIVARIAAGQTFLRPHVDKALRAGNRYLDSSSRTLQTNRNIDGETRDLPVGEVNYMARRTWPFAG